MQVYQFIADSAPAAVEQIRSQLGPDAVVLHVRKLPAQGIARIWQGSRIEVLAGVKPAEAPIHNQPVPTEPAIPSAPSISIPVSEPEFPRNQTVNGPAAQAAIATEPETRTPPAASLLNAAELYQRQSGVAESDPITLGETAGSRWRIENLLHDIGLLPRFSHRLLDQLQARHGLRPPQSLREELGMTCSLLAESWDKPVTANSHSPVHVFVGPSGSGKTTVLCKWLTQSVLMGDYSARVWRLDGATANTAESLSVYAEILGVPVVRSMTELDASDVDRGFVDLPGVDWKDAQAIQQLHEQLSLIPQAQVHLVLNAAYESSLMLAQARAFSTLPITDLIVTHLDEENRWGKIWNLVLGTNFKVGWLSAGQNIPGTFKPAGPNELIASQFASK